VTRSSSLYFCLFLLSSSFIRLLPSPRSTLFPYTTLFRSVVVPRMITLINKKFGTEKGIPQLVLAGSSVDDNYALVLFSSFLSLSLNREFNLMNLLSLPFSILSGVLIGFLSGYLLSIFFEKIHLEAIIQVLILLSLSFILVSIEDSFVNLPFSGILAVMSLAIML